MSDKIDIRCIYQGTKFFWRKRINIDVTIVEHEDLNIYEVIFYDPSRDIESPRIYLNKQLIVSEIHQNDLNYQYSQAMKNNIPITENFKINMYDKLIIEYITKHIQLNKDQTSQYNGNVILQFNQQEGNKENTENIEEGNINAGTIVLMRPPVELVPYQIKHHKILR